VRGVPAAAATPPPSTAPADVWRGRTRIVLSPVAAPSILGLFGFMGATLMIAGWMAGWYGDANTPIVVAPFALTFGGIAQFLAGMWAYKARDGLATAMHGTWGAFWIAFGILTILQATGVVKAVPLGNVDVNFALWFMVLALITASGAIGALAESLGLFLVLGTLAAGSGFAAAGFWGGFRDVERIAGWLFVFSAGFAWVVATAMMFEGTYRRVIIPVGRFGAANMPGRQDLDVIEYAHGGAGIKAGQ